MNEAHLKQLTSSLLALTAGEADNHEASAKLDSEEQVSSLSTSTDDNRATPALTVAEFSIKAPWCTTGPCQSISGPCGHELSVRGLSATQRITEGQCLLEVPLSACVLAKRDREAVTGVEERDVGFAAKETGGNVSGDGGLFSSRVEIGCSTPLPRSLADEGRLRRLDGDLQLVLTLLWEASYGIESLWYPYVSSLPLEFSSAALWPFKEVELLKGSPAYDRALSIRKETAAAFEACTRAGVLPAGQVTMEQFQWAVHAVMSRAFAFDVLSPSKPAVPALVPLCDMANHSDTPNCRYEFDRKDQIFRLFAKSSLEPGDEITVCYGDKSNADLLVDYGFVLSRSDPATGGALIGGAGNCFNHVVVRVPDSVFHANKPDQKTRLELLSRSGVQQPYFLCECHDRGSGCPVSLLYALFVLCCSHEEISIMTSSPHRWRQMLSEKTKQDVEHMVEIVQQVAKKALADYAVPFRQAKRLLANSHVTLAPRLWSAILVIEEEQSQWHGLVDSYKDAIS